MTTNPSFSKRMGRPPTGGPIKQPFSVSLDSRIAEGLREYGDNNLSIGVELAVAEAIERSGLRSALPDVRSSLAAPVAAPRTKTTGKKKKTTSKRATKTKSPPLGRPIVGIAPRVRSNVHLYPAVVEQLRILGDGVVSAGIERAAVLVRAVRF